MFKLFQPYPDLVADLSQRSDGNMRLMDSNPQAADNRSAFIKSLGLVGDVWVRSENTHSKHVSVVDDSNSGQVVLNTDGLITQVKVLSLTSAVADCLPLYFFDPQLKIIGLAHAGWRGVYANIAGEMVEKFVSQFNSNPADILVGVGPGIGVCHFEVKPEVVEQFTDYAPGLTTYTDFVFHTTDGVTYIDLKAIVRQQLQAKGVLPEHIEISPACTYDEKEKYFSRRRDAPVLEAMIAVMGWKK